MKTAILVGATGLVGTEVLNFLLESSHYESVMIITRRSVEIEHPKLKELIIDFDHLKEYTSQIQGDDVFCALGIKLRKAGSKAAAKKVELEYPLEIAKIALQNGARQYLLVSTLGANAQSGNYYFKTKGELEESLQGLDYNGLHILRPSMLAGNRSEIRPLEDLGRVLMTAFQPFIPLKYRVIQARTVAKFMVSVAEKNKAGKHIHESDRIRRIAQRRFDFEKFEEKTTYKDI